MADAWGKVLLAALVATVGWNVLGPNGRQKIWTFLDEAAAIGERRRQEEERQRREQERQRQVALINEAALNSIKPQALPAPTPPSAPHLSPPIVLDPDARWREVIVHPAVVLILGKRGSGKSALAYRLLELFRYHLAPYVVGVPKTARRLLPEWIGIAPTLEDLPPKSIALVDEAYLSYHARGSIAATSKAMSQALNLSRQREQTLIFVSQEARQVDKNIASSANVVVFKDLGMLQLEFDRPELNRLATQAKEALAGVTGDRRGRGFVYAPDGDFMGVLGNALPSFWRPALSRLFATEGAPAQPRDPKRMTPQEKAQKAKEMKANGDSYSSIARVLGVTRGTVVNYVKDYPYRS